MRLGQRLSNRRKTGTRNRDADPFRSPVGRLDGFILLRQIGRREEGPHRPAGLETAKEDKMTSRSRPRVPSPPAWIAQSVSKLTDFVDCIWCRFLFLGPKARQFTQPRATPWEEGRQPTGSSAQRANGSLGERLGRWPEETDVWTLAYPGRCPGLRERLPRWGRPGGRSGFRSRNENGMRNGDDLIRLLSNPPPAPLPRAGEGSNVDHRRPCSRKKSTRRCEWKISGHSWCPLPGIISTSIGPPSSRYRRWSSRLCFSLGTGPSLEPVI